MAEHNVEQPFRRSCAIGLTIGALVVSLYAFELRPKRQHQPQLVQNTKPQRFGTLTDRREGSDLRVAAAATQRGPIPKSLQDHLERIRIESRRIETACLDTLRLWTGQSPTISRPGDS